MIAVRITKAQHDASCRFKPQGVDELFAQEAHGGRAQNDDTLLVQSDDAQIGSEIEHLRKIEMLLRHGLGIRQATAVHGFARRDWFNSRISVGARGRKSESV